VSDGPETCNADPCAAATELEETGVDLAVHVVGFGTTQEENRQLQCIASKTGGRFLGAKERSRAHKIGGS
jgi:Ca-activated chloride channel family protein